MADDTVVVLAGAGGSSLPPQATSASASAPKKSPFERANNSGFQKVFHAFLLDVCINALRHLLIRWELSCFSLVLGAVGSPHLVGLVCGDAPVVKVWLTLMAPVGREQQVLAHDPQDAVTPYPDLLAIADPGPYLSVSLLNERAGLQIGLDQSQNLSIWDQGLGTAASWFGALQTPEVDA